VGLYWTDMNQKQFLPTNLGAHNECPISVTVLVAKLASGQAGGQTER
jgi:hypothetical protein